MRFDPEKCDACREQYICKTPFDLKKDCQDQILSASVYTDRLRLVGDSIEILHNFARKIHLPIRHYYETQIPMYFLPDFKFLELALKANAIKVPNHAIEIIGTFTEGRNIHSRETGKIIKDKKDNLC